MAKKKIELKWIEKGTKKQKQRVSVTAEVEDGKLKLISAKCFPGIICLICGPAFNCHCGQLT